MIQLHKDSITIPVTQYAIDMMQKALNDDTTNSYTLPMTTKLGKQIDVVFEKVDIGDNNEEHN
jgi:hypothetical protein